MLVTTPDRREGVSLVSLLRRLPPAVVATA